MKYFVWFILAIITIGCAAQGKFVVPTFIVKEKKNYELNQEYSIKIGEPMISYEKEIIEEGYISLKSFQSPERFPGDSGITIIKGDTFRVAEKMLYNNRISEMIVKYKEYNIHSIYEYEREPFLISVNENGTIAEGWFDKNLVRKNPSNKWDTTIKYFEKLNPGIKNHYNIYHEINFIGNDSNIVKMQYINYMPEDMGGTVSRKLQFNLDKSNYFSHGKYEGKIIKVSNTEIKVVITNDTLNIFGIPSR